MARLWSGDATDADKAACAQWRAAHPDHERAWNRLQVMEGKLDSVPREIARQALLKPAVAGSRRRRVLQVLGLVVAGRLAYSVRESDTWHAAVSDHSTRIGEIRAIDLPDGTRVVLNTDTAIDVRYDGPERRVILHAGEILVATARDTARVHRPFRVQSRQGWVQALGTRFTVRQDADVSRVAVFEGAVDVHPARATEAVRVSAGQRTVFAADQAEPPVAGQESDAAWASGTLVADNMHVADFLAELGRYRPGLLYCDPSIASLRVTGVFSLPDTDRALLNLTLGLPVEAIYRTRYWVTVQAR
ncbi:DUF4880 domain-containing protein [Cupriavidus basilensis]|nr:DUF4880 domain-containing protein [Cupriavidus basilensis]